MKLFPFATTNDTDRKTPSVQALLPLLIMKTVMGTIGLWLLCLSSAVEARLRTDATNHHHPTTVHRRLTELSFFGREPDISAFPLPLCGGDCDGDSEVRMTV